MMSQRKVCTVVLAVLALGLTTTASRADEPKPPALPPELAWVPPQSAAFLHVRFHELWNSAVGKNIAKIATALDPKMLDQVEHEIGISPSRIDRITVLLPEVNEHARGPAVAIRLTTTRPYDRRAVLTALKARRAADDGQEMPRGDLYVLRDRGLLHFSDERNLTLLFNDEGTMGLLGRLLGARKTGPLSPALQAAAGKNHFVASVDLTQLPRIPPEELPPELRVLRPLLDAKTATLVGNLAEDNADLELRLTFASKEDAAEGKQALEDGLKAVQELLAQGEAEFNKNAKENVLQLALFKAVKDGLKTATAEQKDAELLVKVQVRTGEPIAQVLVNGTEMIRMSSARTQSQNNLKQIGLALHNYQDVYGKLPPAAVCDKNGKPLLSWRVAILPFIESDNLYKQFKLDEPWDSEHNIKLAKTRIKTYTLPARKDKDGELPLTYYLALVGNDAGFELKQGLRLPASFPDGTSNTIWLVEAADGVPWTKPEDIAYDPKVMPKLGAHFGARVNVAFVDGSVRALKRTIKESTWHLLFQRSDGNVIPPFDD